MLTDISGLEQFYSVIAPYYDGDYDILARTWVTFYAALSVESGGPVLEAGCGTGRVSLEVARRGVCLHGVDISEAMLDRFRGKLADEPAAVRDRLAITRADFRYADIGERFPLIVCPGNVINSFIDRQDQRAWLRNARRHLAPAGALVFDTFQPDYARMVGDYSAGIVDVDRVDPKTGLRVRRRIKATYEFEFQRFLVDMCWTVEDASGSIISEQTGSIPQAWYTRPQIENLLELEGLRIVDYWGDFDRTPFGKGATHQIVRVVAR